MRYAVTADLHGRRKSWRRVRAAAAVRRGRPTGDSRRLPRCRGSLAQARPFSAPRPNKVVKHDPELWQALAAEAELVLGNQEWRIRDLLRPDQIPSMLAPLLAAPERTKLGAATGIHGHQLRWHETRRLTPGLEPDFASLPAGERLLFAGHSHYVQVIEVTWTNRAGRAAARGRTAGAGAAGNADRRLAFTDPAPEEPQARWSTLFVNVGPAVGKPSHWLLYDDDRREITFFEAGKAAKPARLARPTPGTDASSRRQPRKRAKVKRTWSYREVPRLRGSSGYTVKSRLGDCVEPDVPPVRQSPRHITGALIVVPPKRDGAAKNIHNQPLRKCKYAIPDPPRQAGHSASRYRSPRPVAPRQRREAGREGGGGEPWCEFPRRELFSPTRTAPRWPRLSATRLPPAS